MADSSLRQRSLSQVGVLFHCDHAWHLDLLVDGHRTRGTRRRGARLCNAVLADILPGCTTGRTPARKRFKTLKELKTLLKPRQGFEGVLDACEEIWPAWAANGCRKLDLRVRAVSMHTRTTISVQHEG